MISPNFQYFNTCKCILGLEWRAAVRALFPGNEGRIEVLAGIAPSSQTVGSILGTPQQETIDKKVSYVNSVQWKDANNYFWSKTFGKVENLTNSLPTISDSHIMTFNIFFTIYLFLPSGFVTRIQWQEKPFNDMFIFKLRCLQELWLPMTARSNFLLKEVAEYLQLCFAVREGSFCFWKLFVLHSKTTQPIV